jgi:hypothetical protein
VPKITEEMAVKKSAQVHKVVSAMDLTFLLKKAFLAQPIYWPLHG